MAATYSPNLTLNGDTTSLNFPQNPERLLRLLPTAVCSDTRNYYLVLTLLLNSTSTRSRGQENISDDIIVQGKDQKEHDLQLEKVIVRLKECGQTLNAEKCQFSMDKFTFFGMVLSGKGISCTEEKVKAVRVTRTSDGIRNPKFFTAQGQNPAHALKDGCYECSHTNSRSSMSLGRATLLTPSQG